MVVTFTAQDEGSAAGYNRFKKWVDQAVGIIEGPAGWNVVARHSDKSRIPEHSAYDPIRSRQSSLATQKHRYTRRYSVRIQASVFKAQHRPVTRHRWPLSDHPQSRRDTREAEALPLLSSSRRESLHRDLQTFCWRAKLLELG